MCEMTYCPRSCAPEPTPTISKSIRHCRARGVRWSTHMKLCACASPCTSVNGRVRSSAWYASQSTFANEASRHATRWSSQRIGDSPAAMAALIVAHASLAYSAIASPRDAVHEGRRTPALAARLCLARPPRGLAAARVPVRRAQPRLGEQRLVPPVGRVHARVQLEAVRRNILWRRVAGAQLWKPLLHAPVVWLFSAEESARWDGILEALHQQRRVAGGHVAVRVEAPRHVGVLQGGAKRIVEESLAGGAQGGAQRTARRRLEDER
mmetsp:Transcript_18085/g.53168  ORF Transcript_18085/g.53168 Transcript_18085/m.53168 type:complete len:266 (+) Transcript_18085:198-995(+)